MVNGEIGPPELPNWINEAVDCLREDEERENPEKYYWLNNIVLNVSGYDTINRYLDSLDLIGPPLDLGGALDTRQGLVGRYHRYEREEEAERGIKRIHNRSFKKITSLADAFEMLEGRRGALERQISKKEEVGEDVGRT